MMNTQKFVLDYYAKLQQGMQAIEVTNSKGRNLPLEEGVEKAVDRILAAKDTGGKLYFIGNGASAAISSHQATDYWKAGGVPATCFNDASLLTCMGNDLGYENVFAKPLEVFMGKSDILMAISSSGKSPNILKATEVAKKKGADIITFSGFKKDNPLRATGVLNFYVPAMEYGHVEVTHHSLCHCILDAIVNRHE